MNVSERIEYFLKLKNLTYYKLSQRSGVPQSTLSNMKTRGNDPSLHTLEKICQGLQISLSQFFMDDSETALCFTPFQAEFMNRFTLLSHEQQMLMFQFLNNML